MYISKKKIKGIISEISYSFVHPLVRLSDQELRAVIKIAEGFTTTNCGWTSYRMKDAIISIASKELAERAYQKKVNRKNKRTNEQ